MTTQTFYPNSVTQNSANWLAAFTTLNNIKTYNDDYTYASVDGKSGTKHTPAKITATKFNISIPTGAKVNKITVQYKQRKMAGDDGYPMLPAPKITLANTGLQTLAGTTPNSTAQVCEKVFAVSSVPVSNITSDNFGVVLEYQKNTSEHDGELRVYWVRVIVDYTETVYTITNKVNNGEYNGDVYNISTTVSNVNKTTYTPTVTITAPLGFAFKEVTSNEGGEFTEVNNRTFTWKPPFTTSKTNLSLEIAYDTNITFPAGSSSIDVTYTVSESLNGATKDTTITVIKERPTPPAPDEPDTPVSPTNPDETQMDIQAVVFPAMNEFIDVTFTVPAPLEDPATTKFFIKKGGNGIEVDDMDNLVFDNDDLTPTNTYTVHLKALDTTVSAIELTILTVSTGDYETIVTYPVYYIQNVTTPQYTILQITGEELNRLGNQIGYTVQSDFLLATTETYYIPITQNYKLGVFNNPISDNVTVVETIDPDTQEVIETVTDTTDYNNLTPLEILDNAEYWSNFLANVNEQLSMTCNFVYNNNYPLYIIITGDYEEFERYDDQLQFNLPCIIETEDYTQRLNPLNYYAPIQELINDVATLTLDPYTPASDIKLYNINLDTDFGINENIGIRGFEIIGNVNVNNPVSVTVKIENGNGDIGYRSSIIDTDSETINIGGLGDLFGFNPGELSNINNWLVTLQTNNIYGEPVDIELGDLQLKIYYVEITRQNIECSINGEDIAYYGAFITDLQIPSGLKTSTSFLSIDGTDTNDAYRQNIREKTITIECDIGDCNLLDSTNQLRELTRLIVNEKDKYNRPIPKRIEFSHYPDLYWEYIIEDTFDDSIDISTYELKIELTVPSGTAYTKKDTIVNNAGYVNGLSSVNPIIIVKPIGNTLTLTEDNTGQKFSITYSNYEDDDLYVIDCDNREVNLRKTNAVNDSDDIDISSYVDFNSDWFILDNDFVFNIVNGIIQTVQYTERW